MLPGFWVFAMKKKICFVSSSGGHWEELLCLKELAQLEKENCPNPDLPAGCFGKLR